MMRYFACAVAVLITAGTAWAETLDEQVTRLTRDDKYAEAEVIAKRVLAESERKTLADVAWADTRWVCRAGVPEGSEQIGGLLLICYGYYSMFTGKFSFRGGSLSGTPAYVLAAITIAGGIFLFCKDMAWW